MELNSTGVSLALTAIRSSTYPESTASNHLSSFQLHDLMESSGRDFVRKDCCQEAGSARKEFCQEGFLSGRNFVRKRALPGRNFVRKGFCQEAGSARKDCCQEAGCQEGLLGRVFVRKRALLGRNFVRKRALPGRIVRKGFCQEAGSATGSGSARKDCCPEAGSAMKEFCQER